MTVVGTGKGTAIVAAPLLPSDEAVMVVVPVCTAVTRPDVDTLAIEASDDDHVTARPVNAVPLLLSVAAVSCRV